MSFLNPVSGIASLLLGRLSGIADVISAVRQGGDIVFHRIPAIGRTLTAFGAAQAGVMTVSALIGTKGAASKWYDAWKEDLKTCLLQGAIYFPAGVSYVSLSLSMLVEKVATLAKYTKVATQAGNLMLASSVALSGFLAGAAIIELDSAEKFSHELQGRKNSLDDMIAFVKEQHENPKEFARQTSPDCEDQVEIFFNNIKEHTEAEKIELLRTVFEANFRAQVEGNCLLGNSTYGFFSSGVAFACSGVAIPIVFGIGAISWLTNDSPWLSKEVGTWFWNQRRCEILPENCKDKEKNQKIDETEFWIRTALAIATAPIWVVPTVLYQEGKAFFSDEKEGFLPRQSFEVTYEGFNDEISQWQHLIT